MNKVIFHSIGLIAMAARSAFQKGSIIFVLFASIAMIGVIGAATLNLLKGPVKAMSTVTKRTVAENSMIASGRMALVMAAQNPGDCDEDGKIEPIGWTDPAGRAAPPNGGLLPPTIGASLQDPWGTDYGYCVWDHGPVAADARCGASTSRLSGGNTDETPVLAVISAGPDRVFQSGCRPAGQSPYILRVPGNDDLVLSYSYAEAMSLSGGLWNLKPNDIETATIAKNLSVTDEGGDEQLHFDAATRALSLGDGGTGQLPNIKTDFIQNLTAGTPVEFLSSIKTESATITTLEENAVAAIVTASGTQSVGLKAVGTSKAIESQGLLDMTSHKIINLSAPSSDTDAATKKYVDDKISSVKRVKCEAFVFSGCAGGTTTNLDKSSLGDCKKACEAAGVRCCHAQFASTANDPNATLGKCVGYSNGGTSGSLSNLVLGLLFPANVAAFCYEQY